MTSTPATTAAPPNPAPTTTGSRALAFAVSLVLVGGGHVLHGRWRRGAVLVAILCAGILSVPWTHNIGLFGSLVLYLAIAGELFFIRPGRRPEVLALAAAAGGLVVLLLGLRFVLITYYMQAFRIPSGGMAPTLVPGDNILVAKFRRDPARGDVIVFRYPENPRQDFVKRVVGVAGDRIEIRGGTLLVNGAEVAESASHDCVFPDYRAEEATWTEQHARCAAQTLGGRRHAVAHVPARDPTTASTFPLPGQPPYVVPANSYFVLGDNREASHDSRYWGAVPRANIRGTAIYIWFSSGNGKTRWGRVGQTIR